MLNVNVIMWKEISEKRRVHCMGLKDGTQQILLCDKYTSFLVSIEFSLYVHYTLKYKTSLE